MFSTLKRLRVAALGFALCMAWMPVPTRAQLNTFSSGSTGADGAFAPAANQTIQVPESGVFNFTTINIPGSVTITFTRNSKNSPVTIRATGDVTVAGTISVAGGNGLNNGGGGRGGPGGYDGGAAGFGFDTFVGATGDGPGGGGGGSSANGTNLGGGGGGGYAIAGITGGAQNANSLGGAGGAKYGSSTILPLIGGSGGGGGGAVSGNRGGAGGGGGGAILIASSTNINFTGSILSLGGAGVVVGAAGAASGGGAGGAIRLIANTITGGGTLNVSGGAAGGTSTFPGGGNGAPGFVRIEAFTFSAFNPNVPTNSASFALPNPVTIPNGPTLRIASVAGVSAPALPLGSLAGAPDIVVPSTTANPVTVTIEATNIPLGTVVQVTLIPLNGPRTGGQSGALAGTQSASTATASLALPSGMSVLTASAVVDVSSQAMFIDGERVNRIDVAATYGGASELTYVTQSGRRIKASQ
ncbi:MAG: hypothetical protein AABN33_24250 [Acidobacteriota bacterium]